MINSIKEQFSLFRIVLIFKWHERLSQHKWLEGDRGRKYNTLLGLSFGTM